MASTTPNEVLNSDWLCTQTRGDIEFEWTIREFLMLPQKNGEVIYSPGFPRNGTEQWKLKMYPQGSKKGDIGWISIYLHPASDEILGIEIECEMTVLRSKKVLKTSKFTYKFEGISNCGYGQLIERSRLAVQDDSTDSITIRCRVKALGTYTTSSSVQKCSDRVVKFEVQKNGLSRDFKSLYENPKLTDFTLISGDKTFSVHKAILASRSPVFAAMFQHEEMDENVKNEVKIENIEPAVVGGLLEFIYTDDVSEIGKLAHGLLAAAEQYGLEDLKELCERTLCKSLNEDNAVKLVVLADLHNANYLKNYVMQYIVDHPEIVQSKFFEFVELPPQLSAEITRALALKVSESRAQ